MKPTSPARHVVYALFVPALISLAGCAHSQLQTSPQGLTVVSSHTERTGIVNPRPIDTVKPTYPYEMRRAGVEGSVNVLCLVDETGAVREAKIADRDSAEEFRDPAVAAIRNWRFAPGMKDGQPIAMRVIVPVRFLLGEAPDGPPLVATKQ